MIDKDRASVRDELRNEFNSEMNEMGFSETRNQLRALCESEVLETYKRREIKIFGLQEKKTNKEGRMMGESMEESANHVLKIAQDIGADVESHDNSIAHQIPGKQ